jgi:uncharacterized protein YjcR
MERRIVRGKRSAISPEKWAEANVKFEQGVPVKELAASLGLKPSGIYSYAKRHAWAPHGSLRDAAIENARMKTEN